MTDALDKDALKRIKAICDLAATNFPANTDVTISCDGKSGGSITVPYYELLKLVERHIPVTARGRG